MKLSLSVFVLLSLLVVLALAKTDPELKTCRHQCKVQRQYGEEEKDKCLQRCEDYYKQKQERERGQEEGEEEWGTGRVPVASDPEKRLRQCQTRCDREESGQQKAVCRSQCQQRYEREREKGDREERYGSRREEQEEEDEDEQGENPYVFDKDEHFITRTRTEHGRIEVLKKFSDKSRLLRGLENYRVNLIETNPQTFITPNHLDADAVLFVAKGRGTITMIQEDKRESFNIEQGHVIRVQAGTPVYIINRDDNEKLQIAQFLRPVNIPGELEAFNSGGPESFYNAFSWELLEAALKTDRRKLEQIMRQKQGVIVKASKEQIQSMSHREEGKGIWPFGESSSAFNLLKKSVVNNKFGELFEAKPNDYKQQLQDLDLGVSLANITRGSMAGPFYHSKATKISIVLDGEGYYEMACPHLSGRRRSREQGSRSQRGQEQRGSEEGPSYTKVSSNLRPGTVFVVPAGHPVATVASGNKNLVILCFVVNAQDSNRYALAGKNNVVKRLEREAKELAFGVEARQVDEAFRHEDEELFFAGPRGGHKRRAFIASA
ncbi:Vicilin Pis v 3.0101 [Euphorbia peplus]|nr:Vicilin Pis v 3.0101 [Euphorbia peplus]